MAFRDPFKLAPINNIAEIADKFTRNEILTSNKIRQIIGFKPSDDLKLISLLIVISPNQLSKPKRRKKMVPMNLYKNIQNLKMIYYMNQYQV